MTRAMITSQRSWHPIRYHPASSWRQDSQVNVAAVGVAAVVAAAAATWEGVLSDLSLSLDQSFPGQPG